MEKTTEMHTTGKWASRWIWAAVGQGLIAAIITILILDPPQYFTGSTDYFSAAKVIAGGGGGVWMFTGYICYIVVGVVATAVTAIFYYILEDVQGRVYKGITNLLAWGHLVFMNVGVAVSMLIMIHGGYLAGVAAAPLSEGGGNMTDYQIHVNILGWTVNWIGGFIFLAVIGAILGGIGYILVSRSK